jgi:hypothetical protein
MQIITFSQMTQPSSPASMLITSRILPASPITGGDTSFPWFGEVESPDSGDPDSPGSVRR